MFIIRKRFYFSASHQMTTLDDGNPCSRLHGHNYMVELVLKSKEVDENGFVLDFHELKPFKTFIDEALDHRHLNDVLPMPPSTENLAYYLYTWAHDRWPLVKGVIVQETPKNFAEYWGEE